MILTLCEELKKVLVPTLGERWRQGNSEEFEPISYHLGSVPPRSQDGSTKPYVLIVPLSGEDEGDMEVLALDIVPHVFVSPSEPEEGTRDIVNLLELIKRTIRKDEVIGGRFEWTGKMSWAMPDYNEHPMPHCFGVVRVEYRTPSTASTLKKELDYDGSIYP